MKKKNRRSFKEWLEKWLDEWKMAFSGVILASKNMKFLAIVLVVFLVFGTLMVLLSDGFTTFSLLFSVPWPEKFKILANAFFGLFGYNRNFFDFLVTFLIALLQGILIGLLVLVWKKRKASSNSTNVQNAGLAAGLAVISSGCPTCGTTILTPVLGTLFSGSGYALAGALSEIILALAIIVALLTLKKIGEEAYVIIISEKYQAKKEATRG